MTEVKIPDIGDFDEVEVIEVLVAVGDVVAAEDALLTLESDKATMEIPSPMTGKITEVKISVGDKVAQDTLVMLIEDDDTGDMDNVSSEQTEKDVASAPELSQIEKSSEPETETAPVEVERPETKVEADEQSTDSMDQVDLPHASPAIRRFSRELGVNLKRVKGSGPKGRILKQDVISWIKKQLTEKSPVVPSASGIPAIAVVDFSEFGEVETLRLSRIKKLSGPHLQRSWLNIPHVTHHDEADITELEEFRKSLKKEAEVEGLRVTILSFAMKVLVRALKKYPSFNSSLSAEGDALILKKYFNIGIAIDTPNGLVVPVVHNVDRKSIFDLARDLTDISERAREGKLKPDDLKGGCMSISSLGGIGGTAFTPIVNAPEVAILGVCRSKITPVWDGETFQPRLMLPLSLSYDHRVVDGAEAARFSSFLTQSFGDVRRLAL